MNSMNRFNPLARRFKQPMPPKTIIRYCSKCEKETKHIRYEPRHFGSKKSTFKIYLYRCEYCGTSSSP